jgi:MIP family channel proteins
MDKLLRPCIAELLGTFMLCFIGAGAICAWNITSGDDNAGLLGIAIAHGLALSVATTVTMNISGGHLNPAITIMLWVYKKIDNDKALFYIIAQLLGALIAGGLLMLLFGEHAQGARLGTPHINDKVLTTTATGGWARYQVPAIAIGIEAVLTFFLAFAMLGTAFDPRAPKVGGFGIGLTIAADILVGGPITGAAMNPARAFGPGIWDGGAFSWDIFRTSQVVYWIGPIIGALAAGGLYFKYILPDEKKGA